MRYFLLDMYEASTFNKQLFFHWPLKFISVNGKSWLFFPAWCVQQERAVRSCMMQPWGCQPPAYHTFWTRRTPKPEWKMDRDLWNCSPIHLEGQRLRANELSIYSDLSHKIFWRCTFTSLHLWGTSKRNSEQHFPVLNLDKTPTGRGATLGKIRVNKNAKVETKGRKERKWQMWGSLLEVMEYKFDKGAFIRQNNFFPKTSVAQNMLANHAKLCFWSHFPHHKTPACKVTDRHVVTNT